MADDNYGGGRNIHPAAEKVRRVKMEVSKYINDTTVNNNSNVIAAMESVQFKKVVIDKIQKIDPPSTIVA